jgi:hypothetical protein
VDLTSIDALKSFSIDTYVRKMVLVCNVCCDALTPYSRWAHPFIDGESLTVIIRIAVSHQRKIHRES